MAAVVEAGLVVLVSTVVVVRAVPRFIAAGVDPSEIQFIVIGDLVSLVVFSGLIVTAMRMRRRPDWHKRLMTVACIMIIGPAVARLERVGLTVPVPAALLLLLTALAVHDFLVLRRLHRATLWSSALVIAAVAVVLLVVGTPFGRAVIDALA
jgi:hypothetical protein